MDGVSGLRLGFELLVQCIFALENPVHPFGQGILSTVIDFGHAHGEPSSRGQIHVFVAAVLASPIRVVDGHLARRQLLECHLQRLLAADGLQAVVRKYVRSPTQTSLGALG
jgi:hypothetical protein